MDKRYLGDGVYAEVTDNGFHIMLTTSDGISVTNRIYLEPMVVKALVEYIQEKQKEDQ